MNTVQKINPNRKSYWQHKRFGKQKYIGNYVKRGTKRMLQLVNACDPKRTVTLESYQDALESGWRRL